MGLKADDSCLAKAGDDEPIFVLRSTDKLAPIVVRLWAELARAHGTPPAKIAEAYAHASRMEAYAAGRGGAKVPD